MAYFGTNTTVFVFVRSLLAFCVCVRHDLSDQLAFKTTKVKDPKLTLAVIGKSNPLIFQALQTYGEKVAEFFGMSA